MTSLLTEYALGTYQVSTATSVDSFFDVHVNICTDLERSKSVPGEHASTHKSIKLITQD